MGWFSRLGNSIKGGVQKLGKAVSHGVDSAVRLTDKVAPIVHKVADKAKSIAGSVATAAGTIALGSAAIPGVGEFVAPVAGAIAAGAKGVQGVASAAERGASFLEKSSSTVKNIQRDVGKAAGMAKDLAANPNMADAKRYGNQVSSMVRHNATNVREARAQAGRIARG